ncbi:hypothetical protein [Nocardioides psychrotolerans]|uniref:hypothetical protein n=1 Tax=Nocardioides psychrotolerans TaxID=1005945 RepID=UPI003137827A
MVRRTPLPTLALLAGLVLATGPAQPVSGLPPAEGPTRAPVVALATTPVAPGPITRLSNGCRVGPRGLPGCGAYMGASHGGNDDPSALERRAGTQLGVRRTYFRGDQVEYAVTTVREDLAAGRLPWISFKLPLSWEDMASGKGDAWTRDLAEQLADVDGPVWLAFHHEPEGDGDMDAWRRMQERLAPMVRSTARNVAFTVILTGWNQMFGSPDYALSQIWPRDTKIDVAGFDIYNEFGVRKHGYRIDEWPRLRHHYFQPLSSWARRHDVAWGLAETGITNEGFRSSPRWIQRSFRTMRQEGGVAFAYFDSPLNTTASYALTSPAKIASFTRTVARGARLPLP